MTESAEFEFIYNLKTIEIPTNLPVKRIDEDDEIYKNALLKVGAERAVIPEKEMAGRFAQSLVCPSVVDYFELSDEYAIMERRAPDAWEGKSLRQLNIRAKYGVSVIAFRRAGRLVVAPHPDDLIQAGDMLVLLGQSDDLSHLEKL